MLPALSFEMFQVLLPVALVNVLLPAPPVKVVIPVKLPTLVAVLVAPLTATAVE